MEPTFSAREILEIAEEIDHRWARFYRKATDRQRFSGARALCLGLAASRTECEVCLASRVKGFWQGADVFPRFPARDHSFPHSRAIAGLALFTTQLNLARAFSPWMSQDQILRDAVRGSENAIIFYRGLKDFACDEAARDAVDGLIEQETYQMNSLVQHLAGRRTVGREIAL